MPSEEVVRELCRLVLLAEGQEQFNSALAELKIALREHRLEAENLGVQLLMNMQKAKVTATQKSQSIGEPEGQS